MLDDDIEVLKRFLETPEWVYLDRSTLDAHAEALARWPLMHELTVSRPQSIGLQEQP